MDVDTDMRRDDDDRGKDRRSDRDRRDKDRDSRRDRSRKFADKETPVKVLTLFVATRRRSDAWDDVSLLFRLHSCC
jgi:hypothetical protein